MLELRPGQWSAKWCDKCWDLSVRSGDVNVSRVAASL